MENNENFDIKNFISPDVSCAPVYVWVWNDVCTQGIIDAQLKEMQKLGIRAFYILAEPKNFRPDSMSTNFEPDYLSEEYFQLCAYAVEKGKDLGMQCWIYDEGGWPSGSACGKVIEDHPEYSRQVLKTYDRSFSAGEVYKKTKAYVLACFLNNKEIIEEGYVFKENAVVNEYVAEKENSAYPDLLNKNSTEYFIKITHEKYASVLKNALGKNVTAVFTDEPKVSPDSFNKDLADAYENLYGDSVIPYLPLIAGKVAPTEENIHILYGWYDLCSKMFCNNFLLPCKKWANENNIAFTGHMDMDHSPMGCIRGGGNFNLMRSLRCMDIPGVDVIKRQIYPEDKIKEKDDFNGYNGFFPRYASSAAAQNGTKIAMSEILGVTGAAVSYDIMRYIVGYQAVRSINIFNLFNFPLGRKGQLLAQELPVFTENQPYYKFLSGFNRYVERLSYISSLGERVYKTALYYPVHDFHGGLKAESVAGEFDFLGRQLEDMMVDFDIVDDDVIETSQGIDNGCLKIGRASYKHIVIPENAFVPEKIQNILNRFIKGGGKVTHNLSDVTPVIRVDGKGLRAMHRKTENADLFVLFRENGEDGDYRVHIDSESGYLLDLEKGNLQRFETENNILNLSLAVGETAVILITDEKFTAENKKDFRNIFRLSDEFLFYKKKEICFDENGFETINHSDKPVLINSGDWKKVAGDSYSGSGVYETTFTLPADKVGKQGIIDLGEVHFAAELYLNGKNLGEKIMSHYRFEIPEGLLAENNNLKIVVTNTSANQYVCTDYFDKWDIKELSPYFETELNYAKDFVSGGLYGPILLYTE
ncbi:MAG: hypothetical protein E7536_04455 [Ruminococcaceae bacterium]|nr:hypothetical protein [Oscillospiraceae bacterium]